MGLPAKVKERKRAKFIAHLRTCGNVTASAKAAAISKDSVYKWRDADLAFSGQWAEAVEIGNQAYEDELHVRALHGTEEVTTTVSPDGKKTVTRRQYKDHRDLALALKGAFPEKYGDKLNVNLTVDLVARMSAAERRMKLIES